MARILIVEDHENLGNSLLESMGTEGYQTELVTNLKAAREKISTPPDLIILDWMLPDGQGLDFVVDLRKQGFTFPVIFLTARAETIDKVLGLEGGANDYVTKPFELRELMARIRVQLREVQPQKNTVRVGPLCIDLVRHKVSFSEKTIDLVKKEYDLLLLFAESPEKVFSRDEILNKVWGYDVFPTTRTVDTHVMLLRQKIDNELIETVRSVGYRLKYL